MNFLISMLFAIYFFGIFGTAVGLVKIGNASVGLAVVLSLFWPLIFPVIIAGVGVVYFVVVILGDS